MTRRIVPVLKNVRWEPNAPDAQMLIDDQGLAVLLLRPHLDDVDRRSVVIFWAGVVEASFGGPNDEGLQDHPLFLEGVTEPSWAGEVIGPAEPAATRHFVVPTKEALAEVHASSIGSLRIDADLDIAAAIRTVRREFNSE